MVSATFCHASSVAAVVSVSEPSAAKGQIRSSRPVRMTSSTGFPARAAVREPTNRARASRVPSGSGPSASHSSAEASCSWMASASTSGRSVTGCWAQSCRSSASWSARIAGRS